MAATLKRSEQALLDNNQSQQLQFHHKTERRSPPQTKRKQEPRDYADRLHGLKPTLNMKDTSIEKIRLLKQAEAK